MTTNKGELNMTQPSNLLFEPTLTLIEQQTDCPSKELLFEKDIWKAEEIGLEPNFTHSAYFLNFSKLEPPWLKSTIKQFVKYQAATKTYSSCRSYIVCLYHFGKFITLHRNGLQPNQLSRAIAVEFISYLNQTNLSVMTRGLVLKHLKLLIEIAVLENWMTFPKEPIIHRNDFPKLSKPIPRFIPETVMTQLEQHILSLPELDQRIIILLLETGRRINEICRLSFDCLIEDQDNDFLLKIKDQKLKKSYLISISERCIKAISDQQALLRFLNCHQEGYLFLPRKTCKAPHMTVKQISKSLNKLAQSKEIRDTNGKIWKFTTHQFRHTVGTRMINAGVSQAIVQRYLGHESPEMTSRYAYIYDETMKKEFLNFNEKLVNYRGEITNINQTEIVDAKWLKHNIMAQSLPNGLCVLPSIQAKCPHANACLTCANFRTNKAFLSVHESQLKEVKMIIKKTGRNHLWKIIGSSGFEVAK